MCSDTNLEYAVRLPLDQWVLKILVRFDLLIAFDKISGETYMVMGTSLCGRAPECSMAGCEMLLVTTTVTL